MVDSEVSTGGVSKQVAKAVLTDEISLIANSCVEQRASKFNCAAGSLFTSELSQDFSQLRFDCGCAYDGHRRKAASSFFYNHVQVNSSAAVVDSLKATISLELFTIVSTTRYILYGMWQHEAVIDHPYCAGLQRKKR